MGRDVKVNFEELKRLRDRLAKAADETQTQEFMESCVKELAARLLAKTIKRTPVGDYSQEKEVVAKRDSKHHKKGDTYTKRVNPSGKQGGTLKRGWTMQASGSGAEGLKSNNASQYVDSMEVHAFGNTYVIEIANPIEYVSYVEFGHRVRKKNGWGWVEGQFMMTKSELEVRNSAAAILEKKLSSWLSEVMK